MENALALPEDNKYNEQLAELMGQRQKGPTYSSLARVYTNKDFEDKEGNTLLPASFHVTVTEKQEDGTEVTKEYFQKTATFRVFKNVFQIRHFVAENDKGKQHINQTLKISDYQKEEMRDELGGYRCGKIKSKEKENYTKEEIELDRKIKKTHRILYGLFTMDNAVDRKGNSVSFVDLPVQMHLNGTNYLPFGDNVLDVVEDAEKLIWNFPLRLDLTRAEKGSLVWYIVGFGLDLTRHVVATTEDLELLKKFTETIAADNAEVDKKFNAANRKQSHTVDGMEMMEVMGVPSSTDLKSNFDDAIPF